MTSGGTEGNMEGLLLGREMYQDGILYFSEDAHYSIQKISNILKIPRVIVSSQESGEMNYEELEKMVRSNIDKPVIVNVNCGTTVKGAYDNLHKIQGIFKKLKVTKKYIHVDAALSGMIVPYLYDAPNYDFTQGIDSIAISMHKFLGCPIMSGVVISRKKHVENITQKIEYINSHDTTILGSRNGQVPMYIWYMLEKYGENQFVDDAKMCVENAEYLHHKLQEMGYESNLNQYSVTVYFKKPSEAFAEKWQLACYGDIAHVVVMQHVDKKMIDKFVDELSIEFEFSTEQKQVNSFTEEAVAFSEA